MSSHGDLAGGSQGDEERDAGREDAAGDEGDPELRAMRAVWLSMRDEEPSAGGLTALLAAAREKAETMQPRAPWWQRLAAVLRRPPALAFATVVVLAGGALFVAGHAPEAPVGSAPDMRSSSPSSDPPGAPAAGGADTKDRGAKGGGSTADGVLRAPAPADPEQDIAEPAASAGREDPVSAGIAPGAKKKADAMLGTTGAHGGDVARPEIAAPRPPPPSAPPSPLRPSPKPSPSKDLAVATPKRSRDAAASPRPAPRPTGAPARTASPTADDAGNDVDDVRPRPRQETVTIATDAVPRAEPATGVAPARAASTPAAVSKEQATAAVSKESPESLDQLYKDCETAARRGDCVAVRKMVGKITKTDRGYRARAAKDAAVAKCLAE
jgi:hypothetical protein